LGLTVVLVAGSPLPGLAAGYRRVCLASCWVVSLSMP